MAYACFHECRFQKCFRNSIIYFNPDVNECDVDNGNCSQICTNTNGSFICECNVGYQLDTDGTTCNGLYRELINYCMYMYMYFYIYVRTYGVWELENSSSPISIYNAVRICSNYLKIPMIFLIYLFMNIDIKNAFIIVLFILIQMWYD